MSDDLPPAPSTLPKYVREPVEKQSPDRLRALAAWAEQLANAKENQTLDEFEDRLDEIADDEQTELVERSSSGATYSRMVDCNKSSCTKCPHGPYRYRTYREGGKVKTEHIGRASE